ncbi:hypothetical protein [Rhodococcus sp. AQ5-07]|uniref:hypothetical protein n=1 Tax=Rhodococcus sp. AQ5-07 TaxID=2054902 RepID=UPI000DBF50D2|nr:hypothetical protein [Rhodococcus sp. AQ5-07]RAL31775.1 hypothetical protein CVN56_26865 [Rhodococcus sp. AQ5-07]
MTAQGGKTKITREDVTLIRGGQVIGVDDGVIGVVGSILLDPTTASPRWVTVCRDHSGVVHAPIPLGNSAYRDGQTLRVPFTTSQVESAPKVGLVDVLSAEDEQKLLDHYVGG